jgi:transposase
MRYWLNANIEDEDQFKVDVKNICETYINTPELNKKGIHVVSTDEMTGIQALEQIHNAFAMKSGRCEKIEFEYKRHGTTTLIANFDVGSGEIIKPYLNETRKEIDFVNNISNVVDTDPDGDWIFICDQLNTHKSELLVKYVAKKCKIKTPLGIKGKEGILKSMKSRKIFLSDPSHKIHFIYTPKHTSWLNQVEIWFSIIKRKLLNRRSSFYSIKDLENQITNFIKRYNIFAKPFKWTYAGNILQK